MHTNKSVGTSIPSINHHFQVLFNYSEEKLTFRRPETSNIGCSFVVRTSTTHYYAFLTCVYCSYNATLPVLGHPGEACTSDYPLSDEKYKNLCTGNFLSLANTPSNCIIFPV